MITTSYCSEALSDKLREKGYDGESTYMGKHGRVTYDNAIAFLRMAYKIEVFVEYNPIIVSVKKPVIEKWFAVCDFMDKRRSAFSRACVLDADSYDEAREKAVMYVLEKYEMTEG